MKSYNIRVYEVEAEEGGLVDKKNEYNTSTKKDALELYKNIIKSEERHNYFWNLSTKYKEVEILIYLYQDFKVIKRAIVRKKTAGGERA